MSAGMVRKICGAGAVRTANASRGRAGDVTKVKNHFPLPSDLPSLENIAIMMQAVTKRRMAWMVCMAILAFCKALSSNLMMAEMGATRLRCGDGRGLQRTRKMETERDGYQ